MGVASEVAMVARGVLGVLSEGTVVAGEVAKIAALGYGIVTAINQVTSGVHEAQIKASDGYLGKAKDVARLPMRKGMIAREIHSRVMNVRWLVQFGTRVPSMEICSKLLEEYVPLEYNEELL